MCVKSYRKKGNKSWEEVKMPRMDELGKAGESILWFQQEDMCQWREVLDGTPCLGD